MIFQVVSDCPSLCAVMMPLGIIQLCKTNVIWGWHERKWSAPCIYANKITFSSIYKELISTLLLHISLTHCSLPSIPIELPKNPIRTLACVTWHTGCGNLPAILLTLLSFILLLTLCASLEYKCLNPGIFTVLSTICVMLLALYLTNLLKLYFFIERTKNKKQTLSHFHIIDISMVWFPVVS